MTALPLGPGYADFPLGSRVRVVESDNDDVFEAPRGSDLDLVGEVVAPDDLDILILAHFEASLSKSVDSYVFIQPDGATKGDHILFRPQNLELIPS